MTPFSEIEGTIAERIAQMRRLMPDSVRLIAVTKQVSVDAMRAAYAAGVRDFGESRVQEAEAKQSQLTDLSDVTWHLIGHLQTNKAQKALQHFQWIHSVDSLKLAECLDRFGATLPQKPQVLLQVKLLPDPNKYGWEIADLFADLPELDQYKNLNIQGLMTIPPLGLTRSETLSLFQQTHQLANEIRDQKFVHLKMNELSMGMSDDFLLAVEAGATMIRPGRILFGDRAP